MAKIFNLSEYLSDEKDKIVIGDHEYEIENGFNALLKIDALSENRENMGELEYVSEFMRLSLGEENANDIIAKNYSIKMYMGVVKAIQKSFSNEDENEKESARETDTDSLV